MHLNSRKLGGRARLVAAAPLVLFIIGFAGTAHAAEQYVEVKYPASTAADELQVAVTYRIWIPNGVSKLRGIIVHQHGAGTTASKEGSTAAYDLHWQALAKKWDCALLGPSYHVLNEKTDLTPGGSELWFDPRRGSEKTFLKALGELADKSGHPELTTVPWALWGHSGGGIWSDVLSTLHPDRVVAIWFRSGTAAMFRTRDEFPQPQVPAAVYSIPSMVNPGVKEKNPTIPDVKGKEKGVWWGNLATFREYRAKGAPIGFAPDPRTGHECGDSRYLAIPFLDACLAMRLPDKGSKNQTLKPMDMSKAWLAPVMGDRAVPTADYKGKAEESVWLPNEAVAKAWMEYVKTGAVSDTTPPPTPYNVRVWPKGAKGEGGAEIVWSADADFESGIREFIVLRDGKEFAKVPQKPVGKYGRPLFQSMTYHDTPSQPLPEMRYLDTSGQPGKQIYEIISVNSVGLKSEPSVKTSSYHRINMSPWYQADATWPARPKSITWGPMSGVAVDAQDNVWVLARNDPPVQVYGPDGKFLRAWGEGLLDTPHQLKLDRHGNVWLADSGNHVILQCTPQGNVIRTFGTRGVAGCDESHFNRPADMVVTPEGEVFVADGYGNARIVHFDKNGKFVKAWGQLGTAPGEFSLPHAIAVDSKGRLYVADRNNVRIQVFDQTGRFLDQWQNIVVPCAFCMTKDDELWVCGSSPMPWRPDDKVLGYPPVDQLFMKFNTSGKLLQLWSVPKGVDGKEKPGELNWAHGIALDSQGNIYAVDLKGQRAQKFVPQESSPQAQPKQTAARAATTFEGEKSAWHEGFARFDYIMDDETLDIQPFKRGADERFGIKDPPAGKHRCVVIVPTQPALGNPWSWRGCYWDHQPQVEVELLKRGFHVAYISANATLKPGKQWDAWYAYLTEKHGLSKKPAFVGMSRGGEYSYIWATSHPSKVSGIYADNPGVNPDILKKLGDLAAADVPILQVCGSIDPLLGRSAGTIENIYQQYGGRVSMMIQEGKGHHPHSLRDPKPIADFISLSVQPVASTPPAYLSGRIAKSSFYGIENAYRYFPKEGIYITCRGPWFTECYERYSFELKSVEGAINVIVPRKPAPGKPWTFRADIVGRDATVDLALLAKGFHIVTGPVPYNGDGPSLQHWNAVYKLLTENGFSKKPVLEGAGGAAGEAYAWAIANPDKVSCIYAENPVLRCTMTKAQPLDNLAVLAKARVPILHVCGSLDPLLKSHFHEVETPYKELGGAMTVIVQEGVGHYPTAPRDPVPVVDFILRQQQPKAAQPKSTATGTTKATGRSQSGAGQYFQVDYPPSTVEGELAIAVTYTVWIPDGVKRLRGVIVHQHGAGTTASIEGGTAAYDLHWQALAKKWDCALLGPSYHVLHEQNDLSPGGSELWFDPRRGSEKAFLKALGDLAKSSSHPELEKAPWVLWGHSGGGIWADVLSTLHPERVVAMWLRSGSAAQFRTHPEFVRHQVPAACYTIPIMVNPGVKEEKTFKKNPNGLEKGPWWGNLATFHEYREQGALIGFAPDPRTDHECGDSRYLAIPFFDVCLALRLPEKGSNVQTLRPIDTSKAWLAPLQGKEAQPALAYKGNPKEAVWLPNEAVAKAWMEYVKTGAVSDTTPPPSPYNVQAATRADKGTEIVWSAEADFESGIGGFIVLRDGKELAKLPRNPVGKFGRPLFQPMTYHDTPARPLAEMRFVDASAQPGAKHAYSVIAINSVGLRSQPSAEAKEQ